MTPLYINHLFDTLINSSAENLLENFYDNAKFFSYPHDIYIEEDGTIIFEVAAVNAEKEDIKVKTNDGVLYIDIVRKENEEKNKSFICKKISKGDCHISYTIPDRYDVKNIKVKLNKGLLTVNIPVKEENKPVETLFNIE